MSIAPGNVQYNYAQLEGIWVQAGGQAGVAPIAAAIAMAESGGNSTATGQNPGSVDRGLWQINSVHGNQSTYDVMGNARAAVAISNNGQNWSPWTTYTSGAYRQFLQTNVAPDTSAPINGTNAQANTNANLTGSVNTGPLPGGLEDPGNWFLNPLGTAGGIISGGASQGAGAMGAVGGTLIKYMLQGMILTMLNPMIQIMAGVLGMTAGGAMIIIGFYLAASSTETGQRAERGAGKAAQAGLSLLGPEAAATTQYMGASGKVTTVSQVRKPAGRIGFGGQNLQYRPARVKTSVSSEGGPPPRSTRQQLNDEANGYAPNGGSTKERTLSPTTSSTHRQYQGPRRGGAGGQRSSGR